MKVKNLLKIQPLPKVLRHTSYYSVALFCERAFLESLSHKRQEGPGGTAAPQWRGVLLIARYFWPEDYLPV
jgi:hypothetical protein